MGLDRASDLQLVQVELVMRLRNNRSICFALYCAWCLSAQAADPAHDPTVVYGKQLAQIICSACHIVASDQGYSPMFNVAAPAFEQIANRPATSEKFLERFITTTHWDGQTIPMTMPAPELTKQEVVAVSRYIMSLHKR